MSRRYHVEGTKNFIIAAIVMLAVGLWAVKDGWFPSESVMQKHPPAVESNFYIFNKSLAVLCLVGSSICGYIHFVVK